MHVDEKLKKTRDKVIVTVQRRDDSSSQGYMVYRRRATGGQRSYPVEGAHSHEHNGTVLTETAPPVNDRDDASYRGPHPNEINAQQRDTTEHSTRRVTDCYESDERCTQTQVPPAQLRYCDAEMAGQQGAGGGHRIKGPEMNKINEMTDTATHVDTTQGNTDE